MLYNIEQDPLEERDLSASLPAIVQQLVAALARFNASQIDQDVHKSGKTCQRTEPCGRPDCRCSFCCQEGWLMRSFQSTDNAWRYRHTLWFIWRTIHSVALVRHSHVRYCVGQCPQVWSRSRGDSARLR